MMIYYIVEENIVVVIACKQLEQQKKMKCHIKDRFKINGKQTIKMHKKGKYIIHKVLGRLLKYSSA